MLGLVEEEALRHWGNGAFQKDIEVSYSMRTSVLQLIKIPQHAGSIS